MGANSAFRPNGRHRLRSVRTATDTLTAVSRCWCLKELSDRDAEDLRHPFEIVEARSLEAAFHKAKEVDAHTKPLCQLFLGPVL